MNFKGIHVKINQYVLMNGNGMEEQRINKYLSAIGFCSRREADRLIESGKVIVDGKVAECGMKVTGSEDITVNGKRPVVEDEKIILALNKPVGIVCTSFKGDKDNVIDFINYPKRVYPIGRLDKNSEGLLLLTNQGDLVNKIMKASTYHEKEYQVTVDKPVTPEFIQKMSAGVWLEELEVTTRKCKIKRTGMYTFDIVLTQGLNRQIRRMCEALGYRVRKLKRVRIMNVLLGDLPVGKYRKLSEKEIKGLYNV